jgi:hypothetical protein
MERQVIRFIDADGRDTGPAVIVVEHGEPTTRSEPPDWVDEVEVQTMIMDPRSDLLFLRLQQNKADLKGIAEDVYQALEPQFTTVERYYDANYRNADGSTMLDVIQLLELQSAVTSPTNARECMVSADAATAWLTSSSLAVRRNFTTRLITCNTAASFLGVLEFMRISSSPNRLYAVGIVGPLAGSPLNAAEVLNEPSNYGDWADQWIREVGAVPLPSKNIAHYAIPMDFAGQDGIQAVWVAAQLYRGAGERVLRQQANEVYMERFQEELYQALLFYRMAAHFYDFVSEMVALGETSDRFPDLEAHRYVCEERRFTILGSVARSADVPGAGSNLSDILAVRTWLESLLMYEPDDAADEVRDFVQRLLIPRSLGDIAIGWIRLNGPTNHDQGIELVERAIHRMEAAWAAGDQPTPFEPNFQFLAHELLAMWGEGIDRPEIAAEHRQWCDAYQSLKMGELRGPEEKRRYGAFFPA